MRRACIRLGLLLSAAAAAAAPLQLDLSTAYESPDGLTVRGSLRRDDARFGVVCLPGAEDGSRITAGASLPWLKVGPLAPAGLIREAWNPLGFGAGSDVFVQRTGLLLDLSVPARPPAALLMPLPRTLGVFYEPSAATGPRVGCLASLLDAGGSGVEAFFSMAERPAGPDEEEWVVEHPSFPGGRILSGAGRVLFASPVISLAASVGFSSGDRFPPGLFTHTHLAVRVPGFSAYVLCAQADRTYVTPAGEPCLDLSGVSGAAVFSGARGSLDVRVSRTSRGPAFAPGRSIEHRDDASITVERLLVNAPAFSLTARLEGGWIGREGGDGDRESDTRGAASLTGRLSPVRISVSFSRTMEELSASLAAEVSLDRRGSCFGMEGKRAAPIAGGGEVYSADAFFSLKRKTFTLAVQAGLERLGTRGLHASASWSSRQ